MPKIYKQRNDTRVTMYDTDTLYLMFLYDLGSRGMIDLDTYMTNGVVSPGITPIYVNGQLCHDGLCVLAEAPEAIPDDILEEFDD